MSISHDGFIRWWTFDTVATRSGTVLIPWSRRRTDFSICSIHSPVGFSNCGWLSGRLMLTWPIHCLTVRQFQSTTLPTTQLILSLPARSLPCGENVCSPSKFSCVANTKLFVTGKTCSKLIKWRTGYLRKYAIYIWSFLITGYIFSMNLA